MSKRSVLFITLVLLCCGALVVMVNAAGGVRAAKMKPGTPIPESSSAYETPAMRAMSEGRAVEAEAVWEATPIPPEEEDRIARERALMKPVKEALPSELISEGTPEYTPEQKAYFDLHGWPSESSDGGSPLDNVGGPDAFGYRFVDNVAPDTATYDWIELRGEPGVTWINAWTSHDDGYSSTKHPIGFNFPLYGVPRDSFRASANGFIQFTTTATSLSNVCLPASAIAGPAICPLWNDLHLDRGGISNGVDVVGYKNFGDYTVIEYDSIGNFSSSCVGSYKFEVILYSDGKIKLQYNLLNMGAGSTCDSTFTIGIQSAGTAGSPALNYVCNLTGIQPTVGLAIWFYQPPGLLHDFACGGITSPGTGNYQPNSTATVTFNARNVSSTTEASVVKYQFNNGPIVEDTTDVLGPNQTQSLSFTTQITMPGAVGDYPLVVWTDLTGDLDRTNDTCRMTVHVRECADFFLTAPGTVSGNTAGAGDDCNLRVGQDQIVAVTIPNDGEWTFSLCGGDPAWDTYIYLTTLCCAGTTVATDDDYCVTYSLASEIHCAGLTAGTYYLDIEPYTSASGTWILNVTQCVPCPDVVCEPTVTESEPNGGCRVAAPYEPLNNIACSDVIAGTVTATTTTRDYDGYRLVVATPQTLTITLEPEFDGTIALYSDTVGGVCPDVSVVTMNAVGECSTEVLTQTVLPGEYHIYVYPPLVTITIPKDYCLTVTCAPYTAPDGWYCEQPVNIQDVVSLTNQTNCGYFNVYSNTCLGSYDAGEDIIYKWTVTQAGSYQITLNPYATTYTGVLLDDNCPPDVAGCIAYHTSSSAAPHSIPCRVVNPGVYYIMVDKYLSPTCIAQFDLTIDSAACRPCSLVCGANDELELTENPADPQFYNNDPDGGCNSNPDQFGNIACGDTVCGVSFTYVRTDTTPNVNYRDTDWYLITVTEPESLAITVVAEFPVLFGLVDYQNTVPCDTAFFLASLTRTDTCVWNTVRTPCLRPGSYAVFVAPSVFTGHPVPREYRLTVSCISGCFFPTNDDCASAENLVIPPNGSVSRSGSTAAADATCIDTCDFDSQSRDVFYRFTLDACRLIELALEGAAGSGDMHISVYNDGQCCVLPALYCNDDWNNFTPRPTWATHTPSYSLASFVADSMGPGTYFVRVARYSTGSGPYTLTAYDNGACVPCDTTITGDSVTVYRVNPARRDSCMEVRFYAPLTGDYAIWSSLDKNSVYPTNFNYEATVNVAAVGSHSWLDPAAWPLPEGSYYKRYVVVRLCPQ